MKTPALDTSFQNLSEFASKKNFHSVVDSSNQQTKILQLPRDTLCKIFCYLDYGSLENTIAVCRRICLEIIEMMEDMQQSAVKNNSDSQYMIACIHLSSIKPEIHKIGLSWMRFSADQSIVNGNLMNVKLHNKLSDFFLNLSDCSLAEHPYLTNPQDKKRAFALAKMGVNKELASTYNLAVCYAKGLGVPMNEVKAIELYKRAADQGDTKAHHMLALRYTFAQDVVSDDTKVAHFWKLAADQGNASAQYNLALCYQEGKGVEKDEAEAVRLYRLAADLGNASALQNLSVCYMNGQGVEKDVAEAVRLYRLAADLGRAIAQYNLGISYMYGQEKDEAEAVRLFRLAADLGFVDAQYSLDLFYAHNQEVARGEHEAADTKEITKGPCGCLIA